MLVQTLHDSLRGGNWFKHVFLVSCSFFSVFGMNVGGVPWTEQTNPRLKDGFRNVMLICAAILSLLLLGFAFPSLYSRVSAWRRNRALARSYSLNKKSLRRCQNGGSYTRLWQFVPRSDVSFFNLMLCLGSYFQHLIIIYVNLQETHWWDIY